MRKVLPWIALIGAAMWIVNDPTGSAATIRHLLTALASFVHGL